MERKNRKGRTFERKGCCIAVNSFLYSTQRYVRGEGDSILRLGHKCLRALLTQARLKSIGKKKIPQLYLVKSKG